MARRTITVAAALLLVGAAAFLGYRYWAREQLGDTAVVRYGVISSIVETTGQVYAYRQVDVAPQVSGMVVEVSVEPGDDVKAGDPLLELHDPGLVRGVRQAQINLEIRELQLENARYGGSDAQIAIATARLRQATVARQAAQEDYDGVAHLDDASTSDEAIALEGAKVNYEIAKAEFERVVHGADPSEIELLAKQRDQARLSLEAAQEQLAHSRLLAPFGGTVLAVNVHRDEVAYARNPAIRLADLTRLEVVAQIDEIDIGSVSVGQKVEIVLDAFPGRPFQGEVLRIAPAATPQRGSTVYEATITFAPEGLDIRPDMSTNLTITTLERPNVLLAPNRAIQRVGQKRVVKVVEGQRAREREVVVGLSNREMTEIVSGLSEGEMVLLE